MRSTLPRVAFASCLLGSLATAQFSVVIPNGWANTAENSTNVFPFASTSTSFPGLRIQHVYDSSEFTNQSITYPILITGLRWRAQDLATTSTWTGGTWNNVSISLSTAAVDYLGATTNFATNHGGDLTVVYSGAVTVQPGAGNGVGVPGPWYINVQFPAPFLYDPNLGDLAVDVDNPSPSTNWGGGTFTALASLSAAAVPLPAARRVFSSTLYPAGNGVDQNILVQEVQYSPASGLYAAFSASPTSGPVGMTANFTDHSYTSDPGGVTGWVWDLDGDGLTDSTAQNPSFTYNTCGAYNVTLTVVDASHPANTLTRTSYIQVGIPTIAASFTWASLGGGSYQFTDTSTPAPSTWAWDFDNDGIVDSNLQNPVWAAPACLASSTCRLTVTNSCNVAYTTTQNLTLLPLPTPSFTFAPLGGGVYQFTDTTTPTPSAWSWDLDGDGLPDSTLQNPVWAYTSPCTAVPVTLTAFDACANSGSTTRNLVQSPNQLTLSNIPNNGLSSANAGNLFDINVTNPSGILICAFDLYPFTAAASVTANFYVCAEPGGFATNYNIAANWHLVATGTGASAGSYAVSNPFTLSNPIFLPQGQYSMAIGTSVGLRYTTLTANLVNAGPDFTITAGRSAGPLFSAGIANRGFAGTFHYSVVGSGDVAGYGYFGSGCAGSLGISSLTANAAPSLGSTLNVTVNNLPINVAIMLTGLSKTNWLLGALPFDLATYGAPGCKLRVSPDANLLLLGAAGSAVWPFTIPNNAGLIGLNMYNQAVVLSPGTNAAGAVGSDAGAMMIGL